MKNLIKIFVFFALTILFASSAYAQLPFSIPIPEVDYSCENRIPEPTKSPSGMCQYWRSWNACNDNQFKVYESGDDCTVNSGNGMTGSYHFYYSGNQYCIENNIGTPNYSKKCVPRTDIVQPTPKLEPAPGFQPLLEKSETQLEIERKAAEKNNPPKKTADPLKKDDAVPKPIGPGDPLYGSPTIISNGTVVSFKPGFNINPGDVVETGDGKTAQLISAGGAIYLREGGTTVEFLGFGNTKVESQPWPTVEDVFNELKSFAKNCSSLEDSSACKEYTATIVRNGDVFISTKMRDTYSNVMATLNLNEKYPHGIVASPTAVMKEFGTEFGVRVASDGATTVEVLEGSVMVMDIISKQSISVWANESLTIPKSKKGLTSDELLQRKIKIDPSSVNKWWERSIFEQISSSLDSTKIIIVLGVLAFVVLIIKRRRQIWPNRFKAIPALKEGGNKIVTDKYKWFVDNSFIAGAFSTMLSFYVAFVSQASQLMPLLKNYLPIFLIVSILGLIFGLLGIKSPRKVFVYIAIAFNIIAIILWLKINMTM